MKRIISIVALTIVTMGAANAQSTKELLEQKQQDEKALASSRQDIKADSNAKKQAKQLKKDGYKPFASGNPIDIQVYKDMLLKETLMSDGHGGYTERYIQTSSTGISQQLSTAQAMARNNCLSEISARIETELVSEAQQKNVNIQDSPSDATSESTYQSRLRTATSQALTHVKDGLLVYRQLASGAYEVMATYSYDKKELERIKKNIMLNSLESEMDNW